MLRNAEGIIALIVRSGVSFLNVLSNVKRNNTIFPYITEETALLFAATSPFSCGLELDVSVHLHTHGLEITLQDWIFQDFKLRVTAVLFHFIHSFSRMSLKYVTRFSWKHRHKR